MESTYFPGGCSTSFFPNLTTIRSSNRCAHGVVVSVNFPPQIKPFRSSPHRPSTIIPTASGDGGDSNMEGSTAGDDGSESEAPRYTLPKIPTWVTLLLGGLLWLSLPSSKRLKQFGESLKRANEVVEVIRDVADTTENIADNLGDKLPEGRFKDFLEKVEKISGSIESKADALDKSMDRVTDIIDNMGEKDGKDEKNGKE